VSWNTSLIAAHSASVSTVTTPSTNSLHNRKVSSPTSFTAVPSANSPTSLSSTRSPFCSDCAIAHESSVCTPITLISGRTALTYAATPDASPPPPIGTKIAWIGLMLPQDFHRDRALAGDHVRIVERVHERDRAPAAP
jgi:hypothetical protein